MTIDELIAIALQEDGGDEPTPSTHALVALHELGTREVLNAAVDLSRSDERRKRILAAQILGELRGPKFESAFPEECCDALMNIIANNTDLDVITAAIYALGHLGNSRADEALAKFHLHPDLHIRRGVAFALSGTKSKNGVRALLHLMKDSDVETRDWATTGIGMEPSVDGPSIREALMLRLDDEDEITRAEALHGLARRGDARIIPFLIRALTIQTDRPYLFEDAAKTWLGIDTEVEMQVEALILKLKEQNAGKNAFG